MWPQARCGESWPSPCCLHLPGDGPVPSESIANFVPVPQQSFLAESNVPSQELYFCSSPEPVHGQLLIFFHSSTWDKYKAVNLQWWHKTRWPNSACRATFEIHIHGCPLTPKVTLQIPLPHDVLGVGVPKACVGLCHVEMKGLVAQRDAEQQQAGCQHSQQLQNRKC